MIDLPSVNTDDVVARLAELLATPSPTGDTGRAIALLSAWLDQWGIRSERTGKGGLVVELAGETEEAPCAVTAHVDTLGAIVMRIKPNGRLGFARIGGYPYYSVNGEYCRIDTADGRTYSGTAVLVKSSVHVFREQVRDREWKDDEIEIRLDVPVDDAAAVRALGIDVGDVIAWDPRTTVTDTGYVKSRHLDDKAGVAILLGALHALTEAGLRPRKRTTFYFSNFEEVGYGAASGVPADVTELIAVDMGALGEGQQGDERSVSICAMDSGGPYDLSIRRKLMTLARRYEIPCRLDIYPHYGSDAEAALRAGGDYRIGLFGPGVDASHSFERTHRDALEASTRLLLAYLLND